MFRVSKRAVTQSALHGPQMREACIPPFRHSGPRAGIHPQKGPPTLSRVEGSSGGVVPWSPSPPLHRQQRRSPRIHLHLERVQRPG